MKRTVRVGRNMRLEFGATRPIPEAVAILSGEFVQGRVEQLRLATIDPDAPEGTRDEAIAEFDRFFASLRDDPRRAARAAGQLPPADLTSDLRLTFQAYVHRDRAVYLQHDVLPPSLGAVAGAVPDLIASSLAGRIADALAS